MRFFDPMSNYDAAQIGAIYERIIGDGIFPTKEGTSSQDFKVSASSTSMKVFVKQGLGFFSGKWIRVGHDFSFTVNAVDSGYERLDSVIIQIDTVNFAGNVIYRTGTETTSFPVAPELINSLTIHEYRIANVLVTENAPFIEIVDDFRGSCECKWTESTISDLSYKIVNVLKFGVRNDGTPTSLTNVLPNNSNVIYYFPEGTYKLKGMSFSEKNNITILAPKATFIFDNINTSTNYILQFESCSNCKIIGGIFDCSCTAKIGLYFINCQNTFIKNVEIRNVGGAALKDTAGISFYKDCSDSIVEDIYIHNVQAGVASTDDYIHANGIAINGYLHSREVHIISLYDYYFSHNITIRNVRISDIGNELYNNTSNDGDGIYIVQFPKDTPFVSDAESNIKIINPTITNCSKRAIKVVTRCVDIIGGIINVSSTSAAIEYQYVRNSTIRGLHISNSSFTAITIYGGDGMMNIEDCYISGNGLNNGIVLYRENNNNSAIKKGGENINISNCEFEELNLPIVAKLTNSSEEKVVTDSILIRNCTIGYFSGNSAIMLLPSRFSTIKKLKISDLSFKYGTSINEIYQSNHVKYNNVLSEPCLINLGTNVDFLNPSMSLILDIDSVQDDFNDIFKLYPFSAKNLYLGGTPALAAYVYEYPELFGFIASVNNVNGLSATVLSEHTVKISGGTSSSIQNIFIPINGIEFQENIDYFINLTSNVIYSDNGMSVQLAQVNNEVGLIGNEISISGYAIRNLISVDTSDTANFIKVKLEAGFDVLGEDDGTQLSFSITTRFPKIKGLDGISERLSALEREVESLRTQTRNNEGDENYENYEDNV